MLWRSFVIGTVWLIGVAAAQAQSAQLPTLHTHESYIDELMRPSTLNLDDPMAVLSFVLDSLPSRVNVYPTENYYYFTFIAGGVQYAGNIRIEPLDSGGQIVHFIYFPQETDWDDNPKRTYIVLDASRGVTVEKLSRFLYRISYKGKSVEFALNDLSNVKPPAAAITLGETFIGPIFDDSGVRFFLVFDRARKDFLYILDETVRVTDALVPTQQTDRILVGTRTGFAFYRDHRLDRKILIGVNEHNQRVNSYFDGPFDQLPDAFIKGDTLRDAILQIEPDLKGQIDRFGSLAGDDVRYSIDDYLAYRDISQLYAVDRCAMQRLGAPDYDDCFVASKLKAAMKHARRARRARH